MYGSPPWYDIWLCVFRAMPVTWWHWRCLLTAVHLICMSGTGLCYQQIFYTCTCRVCVLTAVKSTDFVRVSWVPPVCSGGCANVFFRCKLHDACIVNSLQYVGISILSVLTLLVGRKDINVIKHPAVSRGWFSCKPLCIVGLPRTQDDLENALKWL